MSSKVCTDLDASVVGPFKQTMFLGCSVTSFSSSAGWNEQETSITVELVQDPCAGTKYRYPLPGQEVLWSDADPGFQTPDIGGPVYFRLGDFEFAGVVQSWTENKSESGNPTYSVVISDPRFILQNLTIITSDYAGSVGTTYNLINAYGNLEGLDTNCPQIFINGAQFGSPAGGFGRASVNSAGIPWNRLKESISSLLSGYSNANFSPYGHAVFKGHDANSDPDRWKFGLLQYDGYTSSIISDFGGNGYTANYFVDISEIPFAPTYFRLAGPSLSLMDIINQVTDLAGCDYYIELIVTTGGQKIIKVRCAQRKVQPTLGQIEQFVDSTSGVTTKDVGRELRNEPTAAFLYGAKVQTMYQQENDPSYVARYWGNDYFGFPIQASGTFGSGYKVRMDFRGVQGGLVNPLKKLDGTNVEFLDVSEDELRFAIGGVTPYLNYALSFNAPVGAGGKVDLDSPDAGTELAKALKRSYRTIGGVTLPRATEPVKADPGKPAAEVKIADNVGEAPDDVMQGMGKNKKHKDAEAVLDFVRNFADEYYGKQFLVQLPLVCSGYDVDSDTTQYSDVPTSDGAYPASGATNILGLAYPSTGMDVFTDDSNKISCFVKYIKPTGSGASLRLTGGEYVEWSGSSLSGVFLKADVESEKIFIKNSVPTALVKISNPPTTGSGSPIEELDKACPVPQKLPTGLMISGDPVGALKRHNYKAAAYRFTPSGFAVPMLSNVVRYGPWNIPGPPGPVKFESDDALNPWEYGGYDTMNLAGLEKTQDGVTFMQEGERGSLTVPGYPDKPLGSELRAPASPMSGYSLAQIAGSYVNYSGISTSAMSGVYGPNLTSISANISEGGVTTTYQFSTFTPSFGRMSKMNSDRIKQLSKQRAEFFKEQRKMQLLNSKLRKAEKVVKNAEAIAKQVENANASKPPNNLKVGMVDRMEAGKNSGLNITDSRSTYTITQALNTSSGYYEQVAYVSDDAFYRPVSKKGQGGLPRYYQYTVNGHGRECDPNTTNVGEDPAYACPWTPLPDIGVGALNWNPPAVAKDYLDPFASSNSSKHQTGLTANQEKRNHHDVSVFAFGDTPRTGELNTMLFSEYQDTVEEASGQIVFPEEMRVMATKGPLLLHGWGYDTQGKPIPNKIDDDNQAALGIFNGDGLKDQFLDQWLRKPKTWPVGPVDLRFDRDRGVWTIPNRFGIWKVENKGSGIQPGSSGTVSISGNNVTKAMTSGDGGAFTDPQKNVALKVQDWQDPLESGQSAWAFWDDFDCEWYHIPVGSGSSVNLFNSGTCENTLANGCLQESECVSGTLKTLIAGSGLEFGTGVVPSGYNGSFDSCKTNNAHILNLRLPIKTVGDDDDTEDSITELDHGTCHVEWEQLQFDSGWFTVWTGEPIDGCSVARISGNYTKVMDIPVCTDDDPLIIGCSRPAYLNQDGCIPFGTGLTLSSLGVVNVQRTIASKSGCTTEYDLAETFYKHLDVRTGLKVENISGEDGFGSCDYQLIHDISIGTDPTGERCGSPQVANSTRYEHIYIGTGLNVRHEFGDAKQCSVHIDADRRIKDEDNCNTSLVPDFKHFRDLIFGTGLQVTQQTENCRYKIDSDWGMSNLNVCDKVSPAFGHSYVHHLQVRTGIRLEQDDKCEYFLDADIRLKNSTTSGCNGNPVVTSYKHFAKLNFGENLYVTETSENCEYAVKGLDQKLKNSTASGCNGSPTVTTYTNFDRLNFGENLYVTEAGDDCEYVIKGLDQKISAIANCGSTERNLENFDNLIIRSGLKVEAHPFDDCSWYIDKHLQYFDRAGEQVGPDTITQVQEGCGVKFSTGTEPNCTIVVSLAHNTGLDTYTKVEVAYDICCDSSGFFVATKELVFSDCGLFSGVISGTTCER